MSSVLLRASSIGNIMAYPEKDTLADGAKTYLEKLASQHILDWKENLDTFEVQKGIECEDVSIDLYNEVNGTFYMKNIERINTGLMTGECDIIDEHESLVIDIKTAYSKKTFPMFLTPTKLYEWQLRCYMYLYDVNRAELAYCLVSTPDHLIKKFEPEDWHIVDHINENHRIAIAKLERCEKKEAQLVRKSELAQDYLNKLIRSKLCAV